MNNIIAFESEKEENIFLSNVSNIFIMLNSAMKNHSLERVNHYIGDELYERKRRELENNNHYLQIYEKINISTIEYKKIEDFDNKRRITVRLHFSCYPYIENNNNAIENSIEKAITLVFEKKKDAKVMREIMKCPNCGAAIEVNNTGICSFCKKTFELDEYDWILVDMYEYM